MQASFALTSSFPTFLQRLDFLATQAQSRFALRKYQSASSSSQEQQDASQASKPVTLPAPFFLHRFADFFATQEQSRDCFFAYL